MNYKLEEHLIGGLVKGVIATTDVKLNASDFEELGAVFAVIRAFEVEGSAVDAASLYRRTVEIDSLGWFSATDFEAMASQPISISSCLQAARTLREKSLKSELTAKCAELFLDTTRATGAQLLLNLAAIVEAGRTDYSEVKRGFRPVSDIMPEVLKVYEDLHHGRSYCVPTGFEAVDEAVLDGFSRGDLHLIVGFTGAGKSSLAMTFALNQERAGETVGIVSREMSDIENIIRMQVAETNTPRWYVRKGIHATDYGNLVANSAEFGKKRLFINTATASVEDLRVEVKMMVESESLSILYVDYLQLMKSAENHSSRANEVQKISRTLKEIAMENKIPVVALCQFNRNALNVSVFEIMYQLKESSGLEQDASTIMFVEVEQTQEKKQIKEASITVLKNRNGTPFVPIPLEFQGELFTFRPRGN